MRSRPPDLTFREPLRIRLCSVLHPKFQICVTAIVIGAYLGLASIYMPGTVQQAALDKYD
jgi:hypothetical protein